MPLSKLNKIDLSIIVPMYNVESYIEQCITSVCKINTLFTEIIIIDDGSTDCSYEIVKEIIKDKPNVLLIHQENQGLSFTRNKGMELAKGNYIFFLDSDDWIDSGAILDLYNIATGNNSDIILGRTKYEFPDNSVGSNPYPIVPKEFESTAIDGQRCFINSLNHGFYVPMACTYLYKRDFLIRNDRQFVDTVYEDEVWTLQSMIVAERIFLTNIEFYHYRQRTNSITNSISWASRIENLLKVTDFLYTYQLQYSFEQNRELKSWIIILILNLYSAAFNLIPKIKNSKFSFKGNHIAEIVGYREEIDKNTVSIFDNYIKSILANKKDYKEYIQSIFFKNKVEQTKSVILIYNTMWGELLPESLFTQIPNNIVITTDRKYFDIAKVVIFHIPDLARELEGDLDKPEGQIWIAWFLESDANYPIVDNEEFMSLFDWEMSYRQDADIVFPYYESNYIDLLYETRNNRYEKKDICMLISSHVNKSKRLEYLKELMSYMDIDSYGKVFNSASLKGDKGRDTKLDLYRQYKFVIAFENSVSKDYVTEKFYDPLIAGSVPIYFGAPNIEEFSPGDNSFINVRDFSSPKKLACFIKECCRDESLYNTFLSWKKTGVKEPFRQKLLDVRPNVYISVFDKIEERI